MNAEGKNHGSIGKESERQQAAQELKRYVCDHLCKYPDDPDLTEEEMGEICRTCRTGEYVELMTGQNV